MNPGGKTKVHYLQPPIREFLRLDSTKKQRKPLFHTSVLILVIEGRESWRLIGGNPVLWTLEELLGREVGTGLDK